MFDITNLQIAYYFDKSTSPIFQTKSFGDYIATGQLKLLDKEISEIEDENPLPEGNNYGSDANWLSLYQVSPETSLVVLDHNNRILGFWNFLFVKTSFYEKARRGLNVNKDISVSDLITPIKGSYDVYFVDLFTRVESRTAALNRTLLFGLTQKLVEFARQGILVNRICANLSSEVALALASDFGFECISPHTEHKMLLNGVIAPTQVGELVILSNVNCPLFKYDDHLKECYFPS